MEKCLYWRFSGIVSKVEKSPLKVEISLPKVEIGSLFVVLAKFLKFWCKKKWIGDFRKFSDFFFQSGESPLKVENPHFDFLNKRVDPFF